jgi:hypothetical protein
VELPIISYNMCCYHSKILTALLFMWEKFFFGRTVNKVHTDLQSTTVLGFQILEKDYEDANVCE